MEIDNPNLKCPKCRSAADGQTGTEAEPMPPKNGDISVCIYCGAVNVFEGTELATMTLVPAPEEVLQELRQDEDLWQKIRFIQTKGRAMMAQAKSNLN